MRGNHVSVVVPYYRASRTVHRAVASAFRQTIPPCEVLIVDDGSNDDLSGLLQEFGSKVILIHKPNGGPASARNAGIEIANGDWIGFLDADDYWEPCKLERQLAFSEGADVVGSRFFVEYPGQPRSLGMVPDTSVFGRLMDLRGRDAFSAAMNFWTSSLIVRRSALADERFVPGLEPAEDRDLWVRLAASSPFYLVPEPLATYVQYESSLSNRDADRDYSSMLKVVQRNAWRFDMMALREHQASVYRAWAGRHLSRGAARSALIPAARRLAIQPTSAEAWWIMAKAVSKSVLR